MERFFLILSFIVVLVPVIYFVFVRVHLNLVSSLRIKNYIPIVISILTFLAVTYILFYYSFFKNEIALSFLSTMEELLKIMLIMLGLIGFLYMLIGFFGRRYTLRVDKFNIGGINILFDQSSEIFIKTVGTFIAAKRTLYEFYVVRDNIDQVLDAYFESYKFIRDNLELLDCEKDKELYDVSVSIIKKLNDFLTTHQSDYRRWYGRITADDRIQIDKKTTITVHNTTIEEVQKHYYRYDEIIKDIQELNSFMKSERIRDAFNIKRFEWEE